ncbi:UbiA-like polyprenyltransferase [Thermodesulfobacteriota bacterium]
MIKKIKIILDMIKFQHTIFALPFAFMGAVLPNRAFPSLETILYILLAMVGARSAGMSLNRLIDAEIDKHNPRTKDRPIQRNMITKGQVFLFIVINLILFVFAAYMLNPLAFKLSFAAIAFLIFYPYTKRFTFLAHFFLGVCLSFAPIGGWIAVKGEFELTPLLLMFAVICWVCGFDIIYSLQDIDHDKEYGYFSIPAKLGVKNALIISRILHLSMFLLLLAVKFEYHLGNLFLAGVIFTGAALVYEHSMISENDFSKADAAFFNVNGVISIFLFIFTTLDVMI